MQPPGSSATPMKQLSVTFLHISTLTNLIPLATFILKESQPPLSTNSTYNLWEQCHSWGVQPQHEAIAGHYVTARVSASPLVMTVSHYAAVRVSATPGIATYAYIHAYADQDIAFAPANYYFNSYIFPVIHTIASYVLNNTTRMEL